VTLNGVMAAILSYYTEDWRMFTVTAVRYTFVETPYGAWGATWDKACKSWDVFLSFNYIRIWGIHIGPNCYGLAVSVLSCLAAHCKAKFVSKPSLHHIWCTGYQLLICRSCSPILTTLIIHLLSYQNARGHRLAENPK